MAYVCPSVVDAAVSVLVLVILMVCTSTDDFTGLSCMNISNPWCLFRESNARVLATLWITEQYTVGSGRGRRRWKDDDEDEKNVQRENPVNFGPAMHGNVNQQPAQRPDMTSA